MTRKPLRRLRSDRSGGAAVEFAVVLPLFLMLLVGMLEFANYLWTRNSIQHAAEEAARTAMTAPTVDRTALEAQVRGLLAAFDQSRLQVTVQQQTASGMVFVVVGARYDWPSAAFSGFFPASLRFATGSARVPREP